MANQQNKPADNKAEKTYKVLTVRNIWVEGANGKPKKLEKGAIVSLTSAEIRHYGKAVTKDLPEGEDE